MGKHQNCLSWAALPSIQRYTYMIEEYAGTVTTYTIYLAICFIAMDFH